MHVTVRYSIISFNTMRLELLKPAEGSNKKGKRVGRGTGSGRGGTSTRGHKGAKARTGHKEKRHFEGGQMPLHMRVPKRGFKNVNRIDYAPFNLANLQAISEKHGITEFNAEVLHAHGYIAKGEMFKILANGELTAKVSVTANAFSEKAKAAIEALGGTATVSAK